MDYLDLLFPNHRDATVPTSVTESKPITQEEYERDQLKTATTLYEGVKPLRPICGRCGGSGKVPFRPAGGICYACNGDGRVGEFVK